MLLFHYVNKCEIQLSVTCGILNHSDCTADPFITGQTGRKFGTVTTPPLNAQSVKLKLTFQ